MPSGKYIRKIKSPIELFLSHVDRSGDCWIWTGAKHRAGYGAFNFNGKICVTHRVAWELFKGEIPSHLWVLHKCDNRPCCNPEHLFLGTNQDNVDDMMGKGRNQRGANHHNSKLDTAQVK